MAFTHIFINDYNSDDRLTLKLNEHREQVDVLPSKNQVLYNAKSLLSHY